MPEAPAIAAPSPAASVPSAPAAPPQESTQGSFLSQELRAVAAAGPKSRESPPQEQPVKKPAQPQQKQAAPKPQEQAKPGEPAKPAEEKPATAASEDDWQVEALPTDEPEPQAEAQPEETPPNMKPEAQTRWKELRAKEDRLKEIEPKFKQMETELAQLKATPEKLPEAVENELTELRRFKAGYDITSTEEFKQAVVTPFNEQMARVHEVADFAKIPLDAFAKALEITNTLARTRAVRELFEKNTEGPEVSPEEISIVTRAMDEIHSKVYPKQAELQAKALEIQNSFKGQQEVQTAKQQEALKQTFSKAADELFTKMEARLKPLGVFDDQEFASRLKNARPADAAKEPAAAIGQAQAAVLLPKMVLKYNEVVKQLGEAKAALKARGASGASTIDTPQSRAVAEALKDQPDEGRSIADEIRGFRVAHPTVGRP